MDLQKKFALALSQKIIENEFINLLCNKYHENDNKLLTTVDWIQNSLKSLEYSVEYDTDQMDLKTNIPVNLLKKYTSVKLDSEEYVVYWMGCNPNELEYGRVLVNFYTSELDATRQFIITARQEEILTLPCEEQKSQD